MEVAGRNLLTCFSKVQLAFSRFSRKARLLDTVLVQNWSTKFHKKGQTDLCLKLSDRRTNNAKRAAWSVRYMARLSCCGRSLTEKNYELKNFGMCLIISRL